MSFLVDKIKKVNEMDVAIVIPYKYFDKHRKNLLDFIVDKYETFFPDAEIVIGKDTSKIFNRSKARNNGVRKSSAEYLFMVDGDTFLEKNTILNGLYELRANKFVIPFNEYFGLRKGDTTTVLKNKFINWNKIEENAKITMDISYVGSGDTYRCSGVNCITRDFYDEIGGYDERFTGWGYEDTAFCWKVQSYIGDYPILPGKLYHLWHKTEDDDLIKNRKLALKIKEEEYGIK